MLMTVSAYKCTGKNKGKLITVYIEDEFQFMLGNDEQITISTEGKDKNSTKYLILLSVTVEEWEMSNKQIKNINLHGRKFYAYEITGDYQWKQQLF